jgi:hypothetical protein
MDGAMIANPPSWIKTMDGGGDEAGPEGHQSVNLVFVSLKQTVLPGFKASATGSTSISYGGTFPFSKLQKNGSTPEHGIVIYVNPYTKQGANFTTVRLGIADGPWSTICTEMSTTGGRARGTTATGKQVTVTFSPTDYVSGDLKFTATADLLDEDSRVVVVMKSGRIVEPFSPSGASGDDFQTVAGTFPGLQIKDISKVAFQARPYSWLEFRNIPLHPLENEPPVQDTQLALDTEPINIHSK